MYQLEIFDNFSNGVLLLALSMTRLSVAFMVLPLFSNESVPALVRNSVFVTLAVIAIVVQPAVDVAAFSTGQWISLFAKEAFVGVAIGIFFGVYLWAFEAAGVLIDTQVGSSMAMIFDPLSGHEVTLFGEFFSLWINYLFLAVGGLLLLVGAILNSYIAFPLATPVTDLNTASMSLFESEFSRFVTFTLMIASPFIVVIFAIDMSMGLVNRYAQQLNVLFLSMSLKALAALLMLMVMLPFLIDVLVNEVAVHSGAVDNYLQRLFEKP